MRKPTEESNQSGYDDDVKQKKTRNTLMST